jgi:hypothetical protein
MVAEEGHLIHIQSIEIRTYSRMVLPKYPQRYPLATRCDESVQEEGEPFIRWIVVYLIGARMHRASEMVKESG